MAARGLRPASWPIDSLGSSQPDRLPSSNLRWSVPEIALPASLQRRSDHSLIVSLVGGFTTFNTLRHILCVFSPTNNFEVTEFI